MFSRNGNGFVSISYAGGLSGTSQITYTFSEEVDVRFSLRRNAASESVTFITPYDVINPGPGSTIESTNPVVWNNGDNSNFTVFQFNNVTSITLGLEGNGSAQEQNIFIRDFIGNAISQDTDGDGIDDHMDLDSDGDGCSDANEAFADTNADGGDTGIFGTDTPTLANDGVNANGLVISADINDTGDGYTNTIAITASGASTFQEAVVLNITQNPTNQTVIETNAITFSAIASTTILPTTPITTASDVDYQWQVSTNGGGTFTDITGESGTVASGTEVFLTLNGVAASDDSNQYRLVASSQANICSVATSNAGTLSVTAANGAISLLKTGVFNDVNGDGFAQIGETIAYSFEVTNTGNVAVTGITISDPLPGIVLNGGPIDLDPGENDSTTFSGSYTLTQADLIAGVVTNQATATGNDPNTNPVEDTSDDPNDFANIDANGDGEPDDPTDTDFAAGIPDYSPTIFTSNTTIIGGSGVVDFRVFVGEFENQNSNGITPVEVRIARNTDLIIRLR